MDAQMRLSSPFSVVSVVTLCPVSHRDLDFAHFSGLNPFQRLSDDRCSPRYTIPIGVHQHHYGNSSVRQVLLVSEVLVGGDQHLETGFFGSIQQVPIRQSVPPESSGLFDFMVREATAQLPGRPRYRTGCASATTRSARSSCAANSSTALTSDSDTPPNQSTNS